MPSPLDIATLALKLDEAARGPKEIPPLGVELSLADAYAIQKELIACRKRRGDKRAGVKMGFTSRAKIVQMGVSDMIWGRLTDGMVVEDGGALKLAKYVHPRVEPEIAFLLKKELSGA